MNISVNHLKLRRWIMLGWLAFSIGCSSLYIKNIAVAKDMVDKDWVIRINNDQNTSEPIGVRFADHAAIYFLERDNPNFSSFLSLLQESQAKKTFVRFQFNVAGQILTFIEADNP